MDISLGNEEIQIENTTPNIEAQSSSTQQKNDVKEQESLQEKTSVKMAGSMTEKFTKTWVEKYFCCLDFLKKYFDITSREFYVRFLYGLIPFNQKLQEATTNKPDLYGPFWIYTSLIIIVAASGSLTRYFQENSTKNFFQEFVPVAAIIVYCIGFGLPSLIVLLSKLFSLSLPLIPLLSSFGYSYSPFLPLTLLCSIPSSTLQWILLVYGALSSSSLLLVSCWKQMQNADFIKKIVVVSVGIVGNLAVILVFKLYFFKKIEAGAGQENGGR